MRLMIAVVALVLSWQPVFAQSVSDARDVVEAVYAPYGPAQIYPDDPRPFRSERLNALYDKDAEEANGEVGRIDFDPFVNGQDYQLEKLEVGESYYVGGKAVVRVTFENMGTPNELGFLLVNEDGWKIDDVWGGSADYSYDLLDILQSPLP